jgi:NADH-quinone oxidoreductase subunit N
MNLNEILNALSAGISYLWPEMILFSGIIIILLAGLFWKNYPGTVLSSLIIYGLSTVLILLQWPENPHPIFPGIRQDDYSSFFCLLANIGGIMTTIITPRRQLKKPSEYFLLMMAVVLGAHLLVMSMNFLMVLLSLELISLCSYALAGWSFNKKSAEGSLKYFLFGSVATAITIYGISLLYSITGTLDFSSEIFFNKLISTQNTVVLVGGLMTMAGYLFKTSSVPMHLWGPDVYESAPTSVVAFFSIVPKMAGFGALMKLLLALNLFGQASINWQLIICIVALSTLTVGNFSALWQSNPKRLMAYSSIGHSGFLLIGSAAMSILGLHALLFYGVILLLMNFLVFILLQYYEGRGVASISSFAGLGRSGSFQAVAITIGLISLAGLPITAGFTAKLFIFTGLWESYSQSHHIILAVLFIFGLLNTVISLFYYLKIPFYLFLRESGPVAAGSKQLVQDRLLTVLFMILLFLLFFFPGLLMGWINRINFVL